MKFGFSVLASGLLALAATAPAQAAAPTKYLTVNVIQVCDDLGANCASLGPTGNQYFAAETNAIWAQAGIVVNFQFGGKKLDTNLLHLDEEEFIPNVTLGFDSVEMLLVNTMEGGAYGLGFEGYGGIAIAMQTVMSFNDGAGRLDTIAHEIGHNLLDQGYFDSTGGHSPFANQLMASGGIRFVPTGINQIAPNGPGYDLLTADQIEAARDSFLLSSVNPVPEPGEWAMMVAGLGVVGFAARRKRLAA